MILWISIGVFVISLILTNIFYRNDSNIAGNTSLVFCVITGLILAICLIAMCINFIGVNGYEQKLKQQQIELQYQAEHTTILSRYQTMKDIEEWNTCLASKKKNQRDLWIGTLIPDIYDDLDFVEMK